MHTRIGMPILTPYQAMRAVGAVGVCNNKAKLATALTQRLPSNVRDVTGTFQKDVETMKKARKIRFFLSNATVVATTAQVESKKKCIPLPKGKRYLFWGCRKAYYIFILVSAYPKRGDTAF